MNAFSASASNLGSIITDLAHAGAKNFLVPNLPDVGLLHPLAAQHNAALSTVLDNLDHTLAVNLTRFDVNALFNAVIADAGNGGHVFGLTNVSFPCFDGRNVCADPSSFLFWDTVHPTAAGHQIIGAAAFAQLAVPLPAGIWLLASAFATINVARRRRM